MYSPRLAAIAFNFSTAVLISATFSCGSDGEGIAVPEVATVTVTPATSTIGPGGTLQLQATIKDANGATLSDRQVTWSSSDNAVATVSAAGMVTGGAGGSATITGTSDGKSGTALVEVRIPVANVTVEPGAAALAPSGTVQLIASTLDAAGNALANRQVTWSSDNTSIAAVSQTGLATAVAEGTATITATSEGQSASSVITVTAEAPAIIAGHWSLHETLSDNSLGYACDDLQDVTLVQTGATFTGTNQQTGNCTINGENFGNSGFYDITEGRINGSTITFTEPGAIPCLYQGTITLPLMSGTVSCVGSVDGIQVNATGTWCAEKLEAGIRAARQAGQPDVRRIPTCT